MGWVCSEEGGDRRRFVLQPNSSMSWTHAKWLLAGFAAFMLMVGGAFFALGYPLVLPFSGLELLAVTAALWSCFHSNQCTEDVAVGKGAITVRKGRRCVEEQIQLPRAWAQVVLARPPYRWYPSRLVLRSHGREVELGGFLTEPERQALAKDLRRAIAR